MSWSRVREQDVRRVAREEAATAIRALPELAVAEAVSGAVERIVGPTKVATAVRREVRRQVAKAVDEARPGLIDVRVGMGGPVGLKGSTHAVLPDLLLAIRAGCHVFLVGPAGTGKSTMAQQAAEALKLSFFALSVGPTTPTSKVFGYLDAAGSYHATPFRQAYEHGGLMLFDELDNGHPGLLTELNQALALDICAFPDAMVPRHPAFRLVTTGNTYGAGGDLQYVGRQTLDAATLDRLVTIDVPVDEHLETRIALAQAPSCPAKVTRVLTEVRRLRRVAAETKVPAIFSPRASINAARLLEAGATEANALQWCVVRGLSAAHRTALRLTP